MHRVARFTNRWAFFGRWFMQQARCNNDFQVHWNGGRIGFTAVNGPSLAVGWCRFETLPRCVAPLGCRQGSPALRRWCSPAASNPVTTSSTSGWIRFAFTRPSGARCASACSMPITSRWSPGGSAQRLPFKARVRLAGSAGQCRGQRVALADARKPERGACGLTELLRHRVTAEARKGEERARCGDT